MWIFFLRKKKLTLVSQGVEKENNIKVDKFFWSFKLCIFAIIVSGSSPGADAFFFQR